MSIRGQFYLPLLNAGLAERPEIDLGKNVSIAQVPDDLQSFLCEDGEIVAGYKSPRERVSCGIKLTLDDSNKSWASLFEPERTVSVLQSVIVTARLLTQIPLDYPFWVGVEGGNSGRGRTDTRTYRTGLAYTHQPLDQLILEDAMAVLAQRTPWLIQLRCWVTLTKEKMYFGTTTNSVSSSPHSHSPTKRAVLRSEHGGGER